MAGCQCKATPNKNLLLLSGFLYPGEQMLVIADNQLVVDTIGSAENKLSFVQLFVNKKYVQKFRILTIHKKNVYVDTTVVNSHDIASFGFSKPSAEEEKTGTQQTLILPPIEKSNRKFTVIDELNAHNYPSL